MLASHYVGIRHLGATAYGQAASNDSNVRTASRDLRRRFTNSRMTNRCFFRTEFDKNALNCR